MGQCPAEGCQGSWDPHGPDLMLHVHLYGVAREVQFREVGDAAQSFCDGLAFCVAVLVAAKIDSVSSVSVV
jgi:hypothetical protein